MQSTRWRCSRGILWWPNNCYVPHHRFCFGFGRSRIALPADVVALLRSDLTRPLRRRHRAAAANVRPLGVDPHGATIFAATTAGSGGTGWQLLVLVPPPPRLVLVGYSLSDDLLLR
ncbi:hypothetical protein HK405_013971, partial [Cladochytrium tenue]